MNMRGLVVVLSLAACGDKQSAMESGAAGGKPGSAASSNAPAGSAASRPGTAEPIGLARVSHGSTRPAAAMVYLNSHFLEVDPATVFGDPEKPSRGVDDRGRLSPSSGDWQAAPRRAGDPPGPEARLVIVDRDTPIGFFWPDIGQLGDHCIGFLGAQGRALTALFPDPCPPPSAPEDAIELTVLVENGVMSVEASRIEEVTAVADRAKLEDTLRTYKTSAFFADRNDLAIAIEGGTVGDAIELLDLAHGVGFTGARLIDPHDRVAVQPASDREAAHDTAKLPTVSLGKPTAQGALETAIISRYIRRNRQKLQYCYEKRLLAKPELAGTLQARFVIAASGKVATASARGVDPEVAKCVADLIKTIEFPRPKSGGAVEVTYPFTFHRGT